MKLNNIRLSHLAIDELYKDALVYPAGDAGDPAPVPTAGPAALTPVPASPDPVASAPTERAPSPSPGPMPYKFLGNNRRAVTVLVHSPGAAWLPDDQLSFLSKILMACQMTLADIAIVNTATQPVVIGALRQQLHPKSVLLFGLEPVSIHLPINFPIFRLQPYDDCTYLAAPPLHDLVSPSEESRLLKSKLWVCLKSLFNV
jgi:hypothetical protein